MIDLYMWPTGNGKKISIMLEECELEYNAFPINIAKGDQFSTEFSLISPNHKMPAIVDYSPASDNAQEPPITIFESGAILQYLAEKTGKFLPTEIRAKTDVLQWLFWQVGGFGPMAGQAHHFLRYAPQKVQYAMDRYKNEVTRLYTVLNAQLNQQEFICSEYSIADIAIWPWVTRHEWQEQDLNDYPEVKRWFNDIGDRPAVKKASEIGNNWLDLSKQLTDNDKEKLALLKSKDSSR